MKTTFISIFPIFAAIALSAQEANPGTTNGVPVLEPPIELNFPEFSFIDAAEAVRAIAGEAGTIDRQKYLQDLHKRSATVLSELKPVIDQMRPARANPVSLSPVKPSPAGGGQVHPRPFSEMSASLDERIARLEIQFREMSNQVDALMARVESLRTRLENAAR